MIPSLPLETLFVIWLALLGLAIGSFLNVVIARLPEGLSVVSPRSRCPKCGHQLPWYENIPVLSWLFLRGKCSGCKAPISPRYVLVELLTGLLFMACVVRFGFDWPLVGALTFITIVIPLIFIDAERWELPFELTLPGIVAGVLAHVPLGLDAVTSSLIGAAVAFLFFRVMEYLGFLASGREALGAGDKYLLAMVGATLGWRPLLGVIFLSSVQGAVYGVARMRLTGRAGPMVEAEPSKSGAAAAAATDEERRTFTPAFLAPGLPAWKRVVLVPFALLLQDIPDPLPPDETGEEPEWVPDASNLPFGPWIGLAAIEVMLLGPWLAGLLGQTPLGVSADILFGTF